MQLMTNDNGLGVRAWVYMAGSVGFSILALMAGVWMTRAGLTT